MLEYRGLSYEEGRFFRSTKNGEVYFEHKDGTKERVTGQRWGDPFCFFPPELLDDPRYPSPSVKVPKERWPILREELREAIKEGKQEEFFFPNRLPDLYHPDADKVWFGYYVIAEELWRQYTKTGTVERGWLEALGYATVWKSWDDVAKQGSLDLFSLTTFAVQIFSAKTDEDVAVIMKIIRPPKSGKTVYVPLALGELWNRASLKAVMP